MARPHFIPRSLNFLPREEKFFFLLHQGAVNIQKVSKKLQNLMEQYENVPEKVAEIKVLEEFGDTIIHDIMHALHRTFVTPIDREDVAQLAERLDDVVDSIDEAAHDMLEYKIEATTPRSRELAEIIVKCADELEKATSKLHFRGARLEEILPHAVEINRLENEADHVVSKAMAEIFSNGMDPITIIKWRDVYQQLEAATDRAEDAANVLEGIVLKHM
ncbi:MAG: DUF47 domain-containing protein [Chloroflexi bacterium]|nr:DUF47 domain-containing protein [Chloroflexota bacterium]